MIESIQFLSWNTVVGTAVGLTVSWMYNAALRTRKLKRQTEVLDELQRDMADSFSAAERVLSDRRSHSTVRLILLTLLKATTNIVLAKLIDEQLRSQDETGRSGVLTAALSEMRNLDPKLADDAESAIIGLAYVAVPFSKMKPSVPTPNQPLASPTRTLQALGGLFAINERATIRPI